MPVSSIFWIFFLLIYDGTWKERLGAIGCLGGAVALLGLAGYGLYRLCV
jgi:hypothetical protein